MNVKTIYRNLSFLTVHQILSNGLGFVFTLVLVRHLSEFEFGVYSYIFSTLTIVALFLESGVPGFFLRRWSVEPQKFAEESKFFVSIRILTAIPISIGLLGYVFFIDRFVSLEFLLAYFYFLADGLYQPHRVILTARSEFHTISIIDTIERGISYIGGILLLIFGGRLLHVFVLFLTTRIFCVLLYSLANQRFLLPTLQIRKAMQYWKKAIPLFTLSFFGVLYFRIDMLMIRYFLGVEQVASYSAAYKLMEAAVIIPGIVMSVAVPSLTKLFSTQSHQKLVHFLNISTKYLSILSLPFASILVLYARDILSFLYGGRFTEANSTLLLLGMTTVVLFLTAPVANLLFAMHLEKYQTKILGVLTFMNIGLNIVFLPLFGIVGAAISTLLCELLSLFLMQIKIRMFSAYTEFLHLLCISCCITAGLWLLGLPWFMGSLAFLFLFAIVLFMTKKVSLADLRTLER